MVMGRGQIPGGTWDKWRDDGGGEFLYKYLKSCFSKDKAAIGHENESG